ncbi:MAG: hypothetical protein KDD99_31855, partial [Bacteroidetes bacterium]|nr:hypothetical protein [Bacteroidota bacterium]
MQRSYAFIICISFILTGFTQASAPVNPTWDTYHSTAEAHALLQTWHKTFPNLTRLYSIGKTLKGTDLMVLEITNHQTGAPETK